MDSNLNRLLKFLAAALLMLWVTIVVAVYFVYHKPWDTGQIRPIFLAVVDLAVVGLVAFAAGLIGERLLQNFTGLEPLEKTALAFATGIGILGILGLGLGLLGLLHGWIWIGTLVIVVLLFRKRVRPFGGLLVESLGSLGRVEGRLSRLAQVYCLFLLLLGLVTALAPPLMWDSLMYHLEVPKRFVDAGRILHLPGNPKVGLSLLVETLYAWMIAVRDGSTAAVLGWLAGAAALLGIEGFARRLLGIRAAWLTPAVLLTGASVSRMLGWAYVDLWVMLFGAGMFIALDRYADEPERKWLVLAGGMSGFALGTKYTAGMLLPFAWLLVILIHVTSRPNGARLIESFKKSIAPAAILTGVALLLALPWFGRNTLFTGNPIYPLLFPSAEMTPLRLTFLEKVPPVRSLQGDLFLPWYMTITGIEGGPGFNTSIGPLMLALTPGLVVGWKRWPEAVRKRFVATGLVFAASWALYVVGERFADALSRPRHFFSVLPLLGMIAVAGWLSTRKIRIGQVRVHRVVSWMAVLAFLLTGLNELLLFVDRNPLAYLTGQIDESAYLVDNLGWYAFVMDDLRELPEQARVLFLWEPRGYYCDHCSPDSLLDRWWYDHQRFSDAHEIADSWRREGYNYVLIYQVGVEFTTTDRQLYPDESLETLDSIRLTELVEIADYDEIYFLYALK